MDKRRPLGLISARFLWGRVRRPKRSKHVLPLLGMLPLALALSMTVGSGPAAASPAEHYSGPYFGADNFPPGCIRDMSRDNPNNICHHMRTDSTRSTHRRSTCW